MKKEELIKEYIQMRSYYYNFTGEKIKEFDDKYKGHRLYQYVVETLDTSFRDVHQTAEKAVEKYLKDNNF